MHHHKAVKDLMVNIFDYPHIPYWFSVAQAARIIKVSFLNAKKCLEPIAILVFDEKYNLLGTLTLRDILRGIEPKFTQTTDETHVAMLDEEEFPPTWALFLIMVRRRWLPNR